MSNGGRTPWPGAPTPPPAKPSKKKVGHLQRFEQNLRRLVAVNERAYPHFISELRSPEFLAWFERQNGVPWDWRFEADIDVALYAVFTARCYEAISAGGAEALKAVALGLTDDQLRSLRCGYHIYEERQRVERNSGKRYAALKNASVAWADVQAIRDIYSERDRLNLETGVQHHVDHVIPLQGKLICGLHVANNLQVITATENIRKKNIYQPD